MSTSPTGRAASPTAAGGSSGNKTVKAGPSPRGIGATASSLYQYRIVKTPIDTFMSILSFIARFFGRKKAGELTHKVYRSTGWTLWMINTTKYITADEAKTRSAKGYQVEELSAEEKRKANQAA